MYNTVLRKICNRDRARSSKIQSLEALGDLDGTLAAEADDGAEQGMPRCLLRVMLHSCIQMLKLVVAEFAYDAREQLQRWVRCSSSSNSSTVDSRRIAFSACHCAAACCALCDLVEQSNLTERETSRKRVSALGKVGSPRGFVSLYIMLTHRSARQ